MCGRQKDPTSKLNGRTAQSRGRQSTGSQTEPLNLPHSCVCVSLVGVCGWVPWVRAQVRWCIRMRTRMRESDTRPSPLLFASLPTNHPVRLHGGLRAATREGDEKPDIYFDVLGRTDVDAPSWALHGGCPGCRKGP